MKKISTSIIIPAYNEGGFIAEMVSKLKKVFSDTDIETEIIVVDDGSTDNTVSKLDDSDIKVLRHPCNIGYGNAIKTGVINSSHDIIAIVDADGTYPIDVMPGMIKELFENKLDMLIGARKGRIYYGNTFLRLIRYFFRVLCEFTTGYSIPDVNSGLRVMRRDLIIDFWNVLCGGFSLTTTLTLVSLLSGRFVSYVPVKYYARKGKSKVVFRRDILRAMQIIVMAILFYNPIKIFLVLIMLLLALGALLIALVVAFPNIYSAVYLSSIFFMASCIILAIGFVADQRRVVFPDKRLDKFTKSKKT